MNRRDFLGLSIISLFSGLIRKMGKLAKPIQHHVIIKSGYYKIITGVFTVTRINHNPDGSVDVGMTRNYLIDNDYSQPSSIIDMSDMPDVPQIGPGDLISFDNPKCNVSIMERTPCLPHWADTYPWTLGEKEKS